ncbi:MAG: hypothetical protein M3P51_06740 [Chloroflexota bacterium]|nr:hypothetical protein [Chloroflexota bacterium]
MPSADELEAEKDRIRTQLHRELEAAEIDRDRALEGLAGNMVDPEAKLRAEFEALKAERDRLLEGQKPEGLAYLHSQTGVQAQAYSGYTYEYKLLKGPDGAEAEVWCNYPMRVIRDLSNAGQEGSLDAVAEVFGRYPIIRSWNLKSYTGEPLSLPGTDPTVLFDLQPDVFRWITSAVADASEAKVSPNSKGR